LLDAKVMTSLRTDRKGQRYLRLSPHFYNTDAELQRVVEFVAADVRRRTEANR
jgi:cysteine desulfurase / selenocysteine lyase